MNLGGIAYWASGHQFIDRMKTSDEWRGYANWQQVSQPLTTDANGNLRALPAGTDLLQTSIDLDPASAGTTRTYVLTWDGGGEMNVNGTTVLSAEQGRVVFRYDGDSDWAPLTAWNFADGTPPTNIHVVREDQLALFAQGEIFNPEFLEKSSAWDMLRFKDWAQVDSTTLTSWSERNTPDSVSWGGEGGVPIEVQVRLANETHTDMWVSMPTQADDDYVRRTLTYVRDNLDDGLKVKVEYSNEVWNWSFAQSHYARDQANALWGVDANRDGHVDANDPAERVADGWTQFYGYRAAQVAQIARAVFTAAPDRVDTVLATQTAFLGLEQSMLKGAAMVGTPSRLFDTYAVTTYFGTQLDGFTAADQATVLGWARGGKAGMDAAFREMELGGTLEGEGSLADLAGYLVYQRKVAADNGMAMVAYEGGAHLTAAGFPPAMQAEVESFFERLNADPRMGELYVKMAAMFHAAGGTELTVYSDFARPGVWGDWGVLASVYDDASPRWDALVAVADQHGAAPVATTLASYTLDLLSADLTYTGKGAFTGTGNAFDNLITGGNGGNRLFGLGGSDVLVGGTGADDLDGGTGADRMTGGVGDDRYHVDHRGDIVMERAGQGTDTVEVTALSAYVLGADVENLVHVDGPETGRFAGTGNALANQLTAGGRGDALYGLGGADTLVGGAGNDLLDGGADNDRMSGGTGDDVYLVDHSGDVVVELPGGGTDEVRTALSAYVLPANVERLVATGPGGFAGTGNELDNMLTGGPGGAKLYGLDGRDQLVGGIGNDLLDGGTGADRMAGGAGNDVYLVDNEGDAVSERPDEGIDTVRTSLSAYTLTAGVEYLEFTSAGSVAGYGNDLNNRINVGPGYGALIGNGGNDTLTGGAGSDLLDGGTGADRMTGGAGDDTYLVDDAGDLVIESANGGTDRVISSVSHRLRPEVENLSLTGTDDLEGRGNDLANLIYGNAGDNRLIGYGGDDTLVGMGGLDRLQGGDGDDQLIGNGGADTLRGEAGDDTLLGGDGDDALVGGAGKDILYGGAGADRFVFATGDVAQAPAGAGWITTWADQVGDFSRAEGDRIDLRSMDTGNAAVGSFAFLGTGAFTGHAGEIRAVQLGAGYDVVGDTNGDRVGDFHIYLYSTTPLAASDFLL